MALTHATALRNTVANAIVDAIDAGAAAGTLVFLTSGDAEVATLTFSDPAFGNSATGVATANSITADSDATGGTVTKFEIRDSDSNVVLSGTAGAAGTEDIVLASAAIGAGSIVSCTAMTYTAPA